jgi:hypothetical protein
MKVIKDMEEGVLRFFFTGKFMDIVDNQNIDHLIEMQKVVLVVVTESNPQIESGIYWRLHRGQFLSGYCSLTSMPMA